MNAYGTALALGIIVGLVLVIFVIKFMNKDSASATKYDEMQQRARGFAYKYGFFAMVITELVLMVLSSFDRELPVTSIVLHMIPIMVGLLVQVLYSIWHNSYIGLNTNRNRFGLIAALIGGSNIALGCLSVMDGRIVKDGKVDFPVINLAIGIIFIVIAGALFLRDAIDKREED